MSPTIAAGVRQAPRLVLVESETRVLAGLRRAFGRAGFDVLAARSVLRAVELLRIGPDVVVFDTALVTRDQTFFRTALSRQAERPAVLVTGRDSEEVTFFAEDYGAARQLVKPYGLADILAAVHACLYDVQQPGAQEHQQPPNEPVRFRPRVLATIDGGTGAVAVDGRRVVLTVAEHALLMSLLIVPGEICSRSHLLAEIQATRLPADRHRLENTVAALRLKMGTAELIETIRGVGYRINVDLCEVRFLPNAPTVHPVSRLPALHR